MSTSLLLTLAYIIPGLVVARFAFRGAAESFHNEFAEFPSAFGWDDIGLAAMIGLLAGALWPPAVACLLLKRAMDARDPATFMRKVGGESRGSKLARQERELWANARRIQDLERELRIGERSA